MDTTITNNMTRLSKNAFTEATIRLRSTEDAVRYLKTELITRNVRSNLEKLADGQDMKVVQQKLVKGILTNHPEMVKESVERRVRGWLDPKSVHSLKREDAIEITLILQPEIEKADEFIALVSEEKLHWRSPQEIVYIYGLMHGLTYKECMEILQLPEVENVLSLVNDGKKLEEIKQEKIYTFLVEADAKAKIHTKEDLIRYLKDNYKLLGTYHNTAYDYFTQMIGELESPSGLEEELNILDEKAQKYTIRDILTDYLYQDVVLSAKQKAVKAKKDAKKKLISKEQQYTLNIIQKAIADSWPDEVAISKIKNRNMDVTRKLLILLFLATDGDYDDEIGTDYELDKSEVFEDIFERLNDMLIFSGFSPLDPRNPFDWLIIYCIYVEDLFDIDSRLQSLLEELFRK